MTVEVNDWTAGLDSPAGDALAVTPSDTVDLSPKPCRALYIGGAGNIVIETPSGNVVTFTGCYAGQVLPVRAARVHATSTTATAIVALY